MNDYQYYSRQQIAEIVSKAIEDRRADRWWATYNAALTGALSQPVTFELPYDKTHRWATRCADEAHGPLKT
jgi:hypothetical protein